jgi:hypothetical protein
MPVAAAATTPHRLSTSARTPTMSVVGGSSLPVRFLVELAIYGALACSGAPVPAPLPVRAALGALAPLAATAVWSRYLSPRARRPLSGPAALVAASALFSAASIGLAGSGHVALAVGFEAVAIADALLVHRRGRATGTMPGPVDEAQR